MKYSLFCRSISQLIFYLFKVNNRSNRERCEIFSKLTLSLFRMGFWGAAHGWGGPKRPPSLKYVTHFLQCWNFAQLYLTYRRPKKYMNHVTQPLSSVGIISFSSKISKSCYIKKQRYRLHFDTEFLILLTFPESLKIVLINMVTNSMTPAKMATPSLLKIKVFLRLWRHNFCPWCHQQNFTKWFKLYCRCGYVTKVW